VASYVKIERPLNHVAQVTLNRPDRYNALSQALLQEISDAFDTFRDDTETWVIVVTGAGRGFCGGFDLKADQQGENESWIWGPSDTEAVYRMQQSFGSLVVKMRDVPQPLIAAVNGAAAGGGFSIALACDMRICSRAATFSAAFTHLGLGAADMGTSFFLPKAVGSAMAAEILYTGRTIEAPEALEIGLVSRVVPDNGLSKAALALAEEIVQAASPFGLRLTKEALGLVQGGLSLEQAVHLENRNQALAIHTEEFLRRKQAWTQKRADKH
jgi:enoyl-CoA hydratase